MEKKLMQELLVFGFNGNVTHTVKHYEKMANSFGYLLEELEGCDTLEEAKVLVQDYIDFANKKVSVIKNIK